MGSVVSHGAGARWPGPGESPARFAHRREAWAGLLVRERNKKAQPAWMTSRLGRWGGLIGLETLRKFVCQPKPYSRADNAVGRGLIQFFRPLRNASTQHANGAAKLCAIAVEDRLCFSFCHHV